VHTCLERVCEGRRVSKTLPSITNAHERTASHVAAMPIPNVAQRWWKSPVKAEIWVFAGMLIALDRVPYDEVDGRGTWDVDVLKADEPWLAFLPTKGDPGCWAWDFDNLTMDEVAVSIQTADGDRYTYAGVIQTVFMGNLQQLRTIAKAGMRQHAPDLERLVPEVLHVGGDFPVWPVPSYVRVSYDRMRRQVHTFCAIITFVDHVAQGDFIRTLSTVERQFLRRFLDPEPIYRGTLLDLAGAKDVDRTRFEQLLRGGAPVCWRWMPELESKTEWRDYSPFGAHCEHYYDGRSFTQNDLHASRAFETSTFGPQAMDRRLLGRLSNVRAHQFTEPTRLALARRMDDVFGETFKLDVHGTPWEASVEECWPTTMVNTFLVMNELTGARFTYLGLTGGAQPVLSRLQEAVYRCWLFVLEYADEDLHSFRPVDYPFTYERPQYLDVMPYRSLLSSNLTTARNCTNYQWAARRYMLEVDRAHTAVFRGGIVSRIAQEFGGPSVFIRLQQGPSWTALGNRDAMTYSRRGYCVEQVSDEEVDIICGRVTNANYGADTYLFPTDEIWTTAGRMLFGLWLETDERWYQRRLELLHEGTLEPLSRGEWLRTLRAGGRDRALLGERKARIESGLILYAEWADKVGLRPYEKLSDLAQVMGVEDDRDDMEI
jgi:hypothetical protein